MGKEYEYLENPIKVISLFFFCMTFLLGVPGNVFVVHIAGMKMKRTVNTIWFLNLAIADLLCCFSIPFRAADVLLDNRWPFGSAMCKILPLLMFVNMFASVFILCLISLDRFTQVITPVWAKNHRSLLFARLSCVAAWILAIVLSVPFIIFRETQTVNETMYCLLFNDNNSETFGMLRIIRFVFVFLIPLICITTCYGIIARKLGRSHFHTGRAFRIMTAVIVAFFLCWLPYHIVILTRTNGVKGSGSVAERLVPLVISLAYFNSCLNPVLYVFMGQDFKEKFKLSLRRAFERAFSEDGTQTPQSTEAQ
ncbi:C3a anaphylatoxin chemotactic receptor-like isoform X1 [Xyrauchen texanus]|uniref:C3a anaphylatoxin chemotactic receptor-like isoform X1 n=1 Tax=Xyrauchen texanus TaxID=154827 RepID=UPI002241B0A7|nr:C3a anaphylatoxin chemotactic receptor-like isoform X1 [Xyrauchen texanus]